MQKFNITVSPDFKPEKIAGWYVFNTYFQKLSGLSLSLSLYDSFDELHQAINNKTVDLIYANPFDAAALVNQHGFLPMVRPVGKSDECVIVVSAESAVNKIEDLKQGLIIAATNDPAINMIGMRTLEAADLTEENTTLTTAASFVAVAKQVMNGDAEVGFFLKEAYDELSSLIKSRLKVVIESEISVIYHSLMVGPALIEQRDTLTQLLLSMNQDEKGQSILQELGLNALEEMNEDDAAFMIDLMETLRS